MSLPPRRPGPTRAHMTRPSRPRPAPARVRTTRSEPRPERKARSGKPQVPIIVALVSAGLLVALFLAGAAAESYRNRDVAATPSATRTTPAKPKAPGVGDPVRDGKFQFVVSRVDCTQTTVGLEHLKRTASGKFCVVTLSVKNVADKPQFFFSSAQRALNLITNAPASRSMGFSGAMFSRRSIRPSTMAK